MNNTIFQAASFVVLLLFITGCHSGQGNQNQQTALSGDSLRPVDRPESQTVASSTNSVHILFPKGGEKLVKGKSYTLKWTGGGDSVITIFLVDSSLQSQGVSVSLSDRVYGIKNSGSYEYTIPKRLKDGTYKLQIGSGSSGYFEVGEEQ